MIWRHRWVTREGIMECRDALAYPGEGHPTVLLRQITMLDAPGSVNVILRPSAGYDTQPMRQLHRHRGTWTAQCGDLHLRWSGADRARPQQSGRQAALHLTLQPGQQHDLVLELDDRPLPQEPAEPAPLWRATEAAWADRVPALDSCLSPHESRRSYAVLAGLTSRGGGMVAAATTSLPERAETGRNYDYRYVWIRDQCYAGIALAAVGADELMDDAVSVATARVLEHGDRMAPAYTTTGAPVPDERHLGLPGYPGGFDIIGNKVNQQFQLDTFGEVLNLLATAAHRGHLDAEHWAAAEVAAAAIARRWGELDAGIWEIEPRAWTHSRLIAADGLRALASTRPGSRLSADWMALADAITADTSAHALHADGRWQRSPDDTGVDAALLLAAQRGSAPPDDPRTVATFRAYLRDLTVDGYAYRFRQDQRPLGDAEGSFLLCGYLTALSLQRQGQPIEARAWFERTLAATGPAQLFSEEYDVTEHQMRNLPQAFVHALMLETASRLAQ